MGRYKFLMAAAAAVLAYTIVTKVYMPRNRPIAFSQTDLYAFYLPNHNDNH